MGEQQDYAVSPEEPSSQEPEQKPAGFSIGKLLEWLLSNLITIIIAVVIATVITVVIVRTSLSRKSEEVYKTTTLITKPEPFSIYPLGDFKLNTADVDEPHFIRVTINLGYNGANKGISAELSQRMVQLKDIVYRILNAKHKEEIDEATEKERLKDEIRKAINDVLQDEEGVKDVYYTEFVIS